MFGEMAEVAVTGDQRDTVVDTGLRNEGVADPGFETAALQQPTSMAGAHPKSFHDCERRKPDDLRFELLGAARIAQDFRYHDLRQHKLRRTDRGGDSLYVCS
jgi:hypothetical protein